MRARRNNVDTILRHSSMQTKQFQSLKSKTLDHFYLASVAQQFPVDYMPLSP